MLTHLQFMVTLAIQSQFMVRENVALYFNCKYAAVKADFSTVNTLYTNIGW